ncbi:MAG: serine hydrolase domain-containing protein [Longimicrobiales bacterium]
MRSHVMTAAVALVALLHAAPAAPQSSAAPDSSAAPRTSAALRTHAAAAAADAARAARVDSLFAEWTAPGSPGAAVAVLKDGEIVLERGYGLAQLEHEVPITPATVFHVASVSKQFTAFAIALLAQRGELSLDDDVRTHLPELPDLGARVTLRHLIHHTSGVRDQWELLGMAGWRLDDVITKEHVLALMRRQRELNFPPGSEYSYSNMGYTLLAEVVERVGGMPFPEFLAEHVFRPLGMTRTHMHDDHEHIVPGRAYSYRGGPEDEWRNAVLSYANAGATSLFTTAGDLARWLRNYETAEVGGADAIAQMKQRGVLTSGDTIDYAFAIGRGEYRGRETWGHGGADAGFRAMVLHIPEERLGVVVLSNVAPFDPGGMAQRVADVWLGDVAPAEDEAERASEAQREAPVPRTVTTAELAAYAGTYYSPELDALYHIAGRDGRLVVRHQRLGDIALRPGDEEDEFAGERWPVRRLLFTRDAADQVDGFRLTGGRARNLRFLRLADGVLPR